MQLLDVKFRPFTRTGPNNRAPLVMDLQHMLLGFGFGESKNPLKNHGHVAHQIHGIIVYDNVPRSSERRLNLRFDNCFSHGNANPQSIRLRIYARIRLLSPPTLPAISTGLSRRAPRPKAPAPGSQELRSAQEWKRR